MIAAYFSDVDNGDTLNQVLITSLESVGSLQLSSVDVTLDQVIPVADLVNLTFFDETLNFFYI